MSNVALIRDHKGTLHVTVSGYYAAGMVVKQVVTSEDGSMAAVVVVPLKDVTIAEQDNVVPFPTS
jgi:hypothetical protein